VKQGQLILEMKTDLVRERGFNPMIIVVRIKSL